MSGPVDDPLKAEFDTVAEWTADVAVDLGPDYFLPAACRGSGSPSTLRWFVDRLGLTAADRMLDCGAGVGGPAAFAAQESGVAPILSEPEAGACRASQRLFGFPVVQAASDLPFATASFDVTWALGVLCTVPDQPCLLRELHRVLRPDGRLGLLVFVARSLPLSDQPRATTSRPRIVCESSSTRRTCGSRTAPSCRNSLCPLTSGGNGPRPSTLSSTDGTTTTRCGRPRCGNRTSSDPCWSTRNSSAGWSSRDHVDDFRSACRARSLIDSTNQRSDNRGGPITVVGTPTVVCTGLARRASGHLRPGTRSR